MKVKNFPYAIQNKIDVFKDVMESKKYENIILGGNATNDSVYTTKNKQLSDLNSTD